jgi:hypothetical protein
MVICSAKTFTSMTIYLFIYLFTFNPHDDDLSRSKHVAVLYNHNKFILIL